MALHSLRWMLKKHKAVAAEIITKVDSEELPELIPMVAVGSEYAHETFVTSANIMRLVGYIGQTYVSSAYADSTFVKSS